LWSGTNPTSLQEVIVNILLFTVKKLQTIDELMVLLGMKYPNQIQEITIKIWQGDEKFKVEIKTSLSADQITDTLTAVLLVNE
jgi:hypothetical protein